MNTNPEGLGDKPDVRPDDPRFSSGPCKKHPGWDPSQFSHDYLGRSHRASDPKSRLKSAIDRSHQLLNLPDDWQLAIVPGSDTGAFEMALWSMLGQRGVDVFVWESFSNDWADDIQNHLILDDVNVYKSDYGLLPDLHQAKSDRDVVFVYNGTTSGVRVPNLDWLAEDRQGLVFCDATSAAFAMEMDYNKLDVVTWSWQKVLGSEAGFGMLALGPRAIQRLESYRPERALPKIFRLTKRGKVIQGVFNGATLNTPSMLALEDLHSALNWAESIGGLPSLIERCDNNFNAVNNWVEISNWIDWLATDKTTLSTTSMCLKIVAEDFTQLEQAQQQSVVNDICKRLEQEQVAYDIAAYRSAPTGFRLWGGATIETTDLKALLPWLDWAYGCSLHEIKNRERIS